MRVNIDKKGNIVISDFSATQAFKAAIHMEEDGIRFYEDLAKKVKDAEARREIVFLIEQEKEHLKTIEDLLSVFKSVDEDPFEEDDIAQYVSSHVFDASREKEDAARMDHRHTALEAAMDMEKRSIVFYEACIAQATDAKAKGAFARILAEETDHLKKFAELLRIKCINSQKGCLL